MTVRIALAHRTQYRYDRAVSLSPQDIRLRPGAHARAPLESYALTVSPRQHILKWQHDAYGNRVARLTFDKPVRELTIDVRLVVRMEPFNPFDFIVDERARQFPFAYDDDERRALAPFLEREATGGRFGAWVDAARKRLQQPSIATVDFIVETNRAIAQDIRYETRMEPGVQSCEQTLSEHRGSCRDSAWLLVQVLRHFDVAARFVSGYLVQLARGASRRTDSADFHAWCEAYVPGAGWIGMDATSGLLAAEGHIPLAFAAVPDGAAPVVGYADRSRANLSFDMQVTRVSRRRHPLANHPQVLYPFRYREPGNGRWRTASRPAELDEIALHYPEFELTGEAVVIPARKAAAEGRRK